METLNDNEIIGKVLNGNHDLFRLIVEKYKHPVASVIKGMLGDCAEADDVGQESFIRLYHSLAEFRGESTLKTYLMRIAMNLSLNEIKKRKRLKNNTVSIDSVINFNVDFEMPATDRSEIREMIINSVEKLDPRLRSVFILRIIEGYSTKETAKILKIPLGTVLSRLQKAVEEMRKLVSR